MKTFLGRLWDFLYAQIVVSLGMTCAILWVQIHSGLIEKSAIRSNVIAIAEPYLFFLVALIGWHVIHTSYVLYWEHQDELTALNTTLVLSQTKLAAHTADLLTQGGATSADWQELSRLFKATETGARAYWNSNDGKVTWRIDDNDECRALCVKAGAMLSRSSAIKDAATTMPITNNHLDRWLEFVKRTRGTTDQLHFPDERPDGSSYFQHAATIRNISTVSSILCIERSAYEL